MTITWKNETGDAGPATLFKNDADVHKSWEWGTKPEGVDDLGWMPRSRAAAKAKAIGAKFLES